MPKMYITYKAITIVIQQYYKDVLILLCIVVVLQTKYYYYAKIIEQFSFKISQEQILG